MLVVKVKEETTVARRKQRQLLQQLFSLEDVAVFEISDRVGTITMTFYYKDDVWLNKNSENYTLSKLMQIIPLELLKIFCGRRTKIQRSYR